MFSIAIEVNWYWFLW